MTEERGLVLLTGASGHIGLRILHYLLIAGHRVRLALRSPDKTPAILACPSIKPHAHLVETIIVADIAAPAAFDEAARGCWAIAHVASPVVQPEIHGTDYTQTIIRPAVEGTLNVLRAAQKHGVKRIVVTTSVGSLTPMSRSDGVIPDESSRMPKPSGGPYPNALAAYLESKILAFQAIEAFIAEHNPSFVVRCIAAGFVLGKNELVTKPEDVPRAANRIAIGPLLGQTVAYPLPGWTIDIDDMAMIHVKALYLEGGHETFIAVSHGESRPWADIAEIVRSRFPKEVEEGIFDTKNAELTQTLPTPVNSSKVERVLGIKLKTLEEQIVALLEFYLELRRGCN